jgi:diguanylate cyclase (GGDEF)-like protein/PAS domain S-box-containing protein
MLGIAPAELAGRPADRLIEAADRELARAHLQRLAAGQECASHLELDIRGHAGDLRSVSVSGVMIAGERGQDGHLVLQIQDITERKRLELELRRSAERDPLTGLLNRRGLDHELAGALADNELYGTPATILVCDLDNLKPVNDTLGHRAGDALLVAVAGLLAEHVHDSGVVARTGGDEFLVLLAGTGLRTARAIAQQLRASVSALALPGLPPTSISIGVSALGDGLGAEDALIAADYAMYEAKRRGASRMAFSRQVSTAEITATPSEPWRREQSR